MRIAVWLTSTTIATWTFSARHEERLRVTLPEAEILTCPDETALMAALATADAAVVWRFKKAWFERAPKLRWLVTPAAGHDVMDWPLEETPEGVELTFGAFHGRIMAETVIGMLLGDCRGLFETLRRQGRTPWPKAEIAPRMRTLGGSHVVVLGFGNIGRWIGLLAKPFGARVTGVKRTPAPAPDWFGSEDRVLTMENLDGALPEADHLVLALPGTTGTDNVLDARRIGLLPSHATVTNVGRGNAIDEAALAEALGEERIAAAMLDVYETEPLPETSPLRTLDNVLLMPHASAVSRNYLDCWLDEFIPTARARLEASPA
jgi:phosphoglycerate dehydrogenase-like enzyme